LNTIAGFPPEILQNDSKRVFVLSLAIAKHFFGSNWLHEHVSVENPKPGPLRVVAGEDEATQRSTFKIVDFAELLINLQYVDGFDDCIVRMRQGVIEATYAELDFGRMLFCGGAVFRFVKPEGTKGRDYDIEITLPDGVIVCADAKCKIETTEFDAKTLRRTLQSARTQFPRDVPSAIFVKIPPAWLNRLEDARQLQEVARVFLANDTQRVVSVKYYMTYLTYRNGMLTHSHGFKEISNPNNRFDATRNWDMFAEPNPTSNWNGMPLVWKRLLFFPKDGP